MKNDIIAQVLQSLADANDGKLTPELVLQSAKSPKSPLHDCFTWDNAKAAHEFRLDEARTLIRSVRVEVTTTEYTLNAPQFVRDPSADEDQQGYISVGALRGDEDMARAAVVAEFARASAALTRAKAVAAVLNLTGEIDDLQGRIEIVAHKAQREPRKAA